MGAESRSKLDFLYQDVLGEVDGLVHRLEAVSAQVAAVAARSPGEVAAHTSRRRAAGRGVAGLLLAFVIAGGAGVLGFVSGRERGHEETRDERAAASWANTRTGKLARQLAEAGSLEDLALCRGKGWTAEDGACFPLPAADGKVGGWRVVKP